MRIRLDMKMMSSVLSEEGEGDVLRKPMFFLGPRWGEGGPAIKPAVWMDFAAGFCSI